MRECVIKALEDHTDICCIGWGFMGKVLEIPIENFLKVYYEGWPASPRLHKAFVEMAEYLKPCSPEDFL